MTQLFCRPAIYATLLTLIGIVVWLGLLLYAIDLVTEKEKRKKLIGAVILIAIVVIPVCIVLYIAFAEQLC